MFWKFTSETKHEPFEDLDGKLLAPVNLYVYDDMRGVKWTVQATSDGWRAAPQVDAYGILKGKFMLASFGPTNTTNAAREMVLNIEDHAESWRVSSKSSSSSLWLLAVIGYLIWEDGNG